MYRFCLQKCVFKSKTFVGYRSTEAVISRDAPTGLLTASTNSDRSVGPVNSLLKLQYILF